MKIRLSLRLYVLVVMLLTGVTTIFALSALSLHYFFSGMDKVMLRTLTAEAYQAEVSDGTPYFDVLPGDRDENTEAIFIATRWQDLPQQIQENFSEKTLNFHTLSKEIQGGSPITLTPPELGYFLTKVKVHDEIRFAGAIFERKGELRIGKLPHFIIILITAIIAIAIFTIILFIVMRTVSSPVERLKNWAKQLNDESLEKPVPDFKYSELNTLANIIKNSLDSVHDSLEREKRFLGFASHELRTPIAVTRTNSELLRKLIEKEARKEKQLEVLERVERAGMTMTDLTETLLWLNRQEDKALAINPVSPGELMRKIVSELNYLISSKPINIELETDDSVYQLPETLCHIVIANLIRNAIQHTNEGTVTIKQSRLSITVTNLDSSEGAPSEELGFGLGLELVERLTEKYQWQYTNNALPSGREVTVTFVAF